jgi:hypothetical protein
LRCGQGYEATEADVLADNPDLREDNLMHESERFEMEKTLKESTMFRMLIETLDYGPLMETDDETDRDDHPERMEARCDICDQIAERWVAGRYTGKRWKTELGLAQADCDELVSKWYGSELLDELVEALWDTGETIKNERIAEYVGRTKIAEFFQTTSAKDVEEFKDECSCGFSGTPIDGSPFDRDASDSYAEEYWEAHHE